MLLFGIVLRCRGEAELSSSGSLKTVGDITSSMIVCTSKCKVDSIVDYLLSYGYFTFGTLNEFHPETNCTQENGSLFDICNRVCCEVQLNTSIKTYLERVQLYFTANSVADVKQVPILLSAIGSSTYVPACT